MSHSKLKKNLESLELKKCLTMFLKQNDCIEQWSMKNFLSHPSSILTILKQVVFNKTKTHPLSSHRIISIFIVRILLNFLYILERTQPVGKLSDVWVCTER